MIELRDVIDYLNDTTCCDDRKEDEIFGPGYCLAIRELERLEKFLETKSKCRG